MVSWAGSAGDRNPGYKIPEPEMCIRDRQVYGEAMGVLSGAALLNYAYETMLKAFGLTERPQAVISAMEIMTHNTGLYGMLGGQRVDVENDGKPVSREILDYIYENKTSALIQACLLYTSRCV